MAKKEKKKNMCFPSLLLSGNHDSQQYISLFRTNSTTKKHQNIYKNSDSQIWEVKVIFPAIYSVLVVWIKISL